jgi:hypothetical protein
VFCQVGTARVVRTDGIGYDPTDGALTAPYPDVPARATGAAVLGMASAAALFELTFAICARTFRDAVRESPRNLCGIGGRLPT